MVSTESAPFTSTDLRREISVFLRAADDPDSLTFKQVRLAVEESLAVPKGSLSNAGFKSKIKATVLSVMAEIDGEAGNENAEDEKEDAEEFEENSPDSDQDDDDANDNTNNKKGNRNNNKRGRDRVESSPDSHSKSAGRKRREPGPDSESADSESGDDDAANDKVAGKGRGQKAATASGVAKKGKVKGAGKADPGKSKVRGHEVGGGAEDEDATLVCVLSQTKLNRRQVNVRDWKGRVQVDIREHYQRKGTEDFAPSRKGISLNPIQWKALKKATRHVDEMLRQMA